MTESKTECQNLKDEIDLLKEQISKLNERNAQLEKEVEFLRLHPTLAQGLKGERLICSLTEGIATLLNTEFDVRTKTDVKLEVKFSKLHAPSNSSTRRWTWSKPLGWLDKGKEYDFLILIGEKDNRFKAQYKDESPYVIFLIPKRHVPDICQSGKSIGANVNLSTNLHTVRSKQGQIIISHMISSSSLEKIIEASRT